MGLFGMGFLVSLIVVIYGLLWFIDTRTAVGLSGLLYSFYEFLSYLAWAVSVFLVKSALWVLANCEERICTKT